MSGTTRLMTRLFLAASSICFLLQAQDFKKQVIYQIVTDRFFDGDASNNNPPQSSGLYDSTKTNFQVYWGGDLAGIQQKLSYIKGLGATAIWISPPLDNQNGDTRGLAAYHGYWNRDFKRVEEHQGDGGNSWAAFDALVSAAHANGIKVIVDFVPNHSSNDDSAEFGALYDNGTLLATSTNDPNGYFHHNANIADFNDRYQLQYWTLANLADLNQENAAIDAYLKDALRQLAQHGADGFRVDAVKHVTWGWEYSMVNSIFNNGPSFVFGEWLLGGGVNDALYRDAYKFANKSGMSLLDFGYNVALRNVFAYDRPFSDLDTAIATENANFTSANDLVTFLDNHDIPRFLSIRNNNNRLQEATAVLLTSRGIPIVYYGDEQYAHNDTNGGNDPYNRVQMPAFSTTTTMYQEIKKLATLRQSNNALAYGTSKQRWINSDVYIFERQFYNDIVLVAVNKSDTASYGISGLNTALSAGSYGDYLGGLLGGTGITVNSGTGGNNPVAQFTLPAHTVAVWQATGAASAPQVGSIGPYVGQAGTKVTIAGRGFGSATGSVRFGTTAATIQSWSATSATFTVPSVTPGSYQVALKNAGGTAANTIPFTVLTGNLIPVTFTVNNATPTNFGDSIFLTGNVVELGNWTTTFDSAAGPMLTPNYPNWFLNVSVPAGKTIQFKFVKIAAGGAVTWENGANHTYTVPTSGTGAVTVNWQY